MFYNKKNDAGRREKVKAKTDFLATFWQPKSIKSRLARPIESNSMARFRSAENMRIKSPLRTEFIPTLAELDQGKVPLKG